jgi:exosome complex component RRP45
MASALDCAQPGPRCQGTREQGPLKPQHSLPCQLVALPAAQDGNIVAVDPCLREEAAQAGGLTLVMNPHKEVCAVQKADGVGITADQLLR